MPEWFSVDEVLQAALFSILGAILFGISFFLAEKLTPYSIEKELIDQKNVALAIVLGSMAIALGLVISAAIGG